MTVAVPDYPVAPDGWTAVRRGNPEHWSLSHDEAITLIAVADKLGLRVGAVGRLAVRVSDEDRRVFQKDGYSPNRWAWGFAIRFPLGGDGWGRWPIHTAYDLYYWQHRITGSPPGRGERARADARAWHKTLTTNGRNA